ncbi:MAG: hypothetical protein H0T70_04605, partial [Acidimicrobiia bacterium]|nr:hypothetical protein [Acidimicrobiia bacterium]
MRRVEAVARLNEAGVECGVLVAPVLPGISDGDDQLEAVVKACVEAGARSITPLLLHLRPGVREHYMGWLAGARPDLLADYQRRYPRAYASRQTQHALAARVAALVARHGGRSAGPAGARHRRLEPQAGRPPPPRRPVRWVSVSERSAGSSGLVVGLGGLFVTALVEFLVGLLGHAVNRLLGLGAHRLDAIAELVQTVVVVVDGPRR